MPRLRRLGAWWESHSWLGKSVSFGCRLLLGVIFIAAGAQKLGSPDAFLGVVLKYEWISVGLAQVIVEYLPWLEMMAGLWLLVGFKTRSAALVIAGLLVVFLVMLGIKYHSTDVICGCFGTWRPEFPKTAFWRDVALLIPAVYLTFSRQDFLSLDRLIHRGEEQKENQGGTAEDAEERGGSKNGE